MKFLIVANGPFLAREIIVELSKGKTIIALDGASNKLAKLGIKPDIILGDFDSIDEELNQYWGIRKTFKDMDDQDEPYMGKYGCKIVPAKDQCATDLEKAIKYCDKHAAGCQATVESIDIVCATGARMDHTLGNIRVLKKQYNEKRPIALYTESQILTFVKNQETKIVGEVKDYCGVMAFPEGSFTSNGLCWDVSDYKLIFAETDSTCNQLGKQDEIDQKNAAELQSGRKTSIIKEATVNITGEALVINPGILHSQREFNNLTYRDQLAKLSLQEDFELFETTASDLQKFKDIKRIAKKLLNVHPKSQDEENTTGTYYVSHRKALIFSSASKQTAVDDAVLVSMSKSKSKSYKEFLSQYNGDLDTIQATLARKDKTELIKMLSHISSKRFK